jgi:hypothetical protein
MRFAGHEPGGGRGWSWRGSLEIAKAPAATEVPGAVMGIPAVLIGDPAAVRGPRGLAAWACAN